eukprot:202077-Hanusia_phi.AAC.2
MSPSAGWQGCAAHEKEAWSPFTCRLDLCLADQDPFTFFDYKLSLTHLLGICLSTKHAVYRPSKVFWIAHVAFAIAMFCAWDLPGSTKHLFLISLLSILLHVLVAVALVLDILMDSCDNPHKPFDIHMYIIAEIFCSMVMAFFTFHVLADAVPQYSDMGDDSQELQQFCRGLFLHKDIPCRNKHTISCMICGVISSYTENPGPFFAFVRISCIIAFCYCIVMLRLSVFYQLYNGRRGFHEEAVRDDEPNCVICLERKAQWALIPCGHRCLCESCKDRAGLNPCAICRHTPIRVLLRIY